MLARECDVAVFIVWRQGRTQGGGGCRDVTPQNQNLKNTDFVDMISKFLRDLNFYVIYPSVEISHWNQLMTVH
jgi:hypothetical protein